MSLNTSLAVKYRPQDFKDVVGQSVVKEILQNQLASNEVRQAYLFVGGSGTGKTTVARIFANRIDSDNIIEIDGASNNGVDNIRKIIDFAKSKPVLGTHKIFIIDEVHMLSIGAFNALLKIIEEPPSHVIFILATTEAHKIPKTIMSRVQRFDFNLIKWELIQERLLYIADMEDISLVYGASEVLAKMAKGGMRKAITLLDTCSSPGDTLTLDDVVNRLGTGGNRDYLQILTYVVTGKEEKLINYVDKLYYEGKPLKKLYLDYINFTSNVLIYKITGKMECISIEERYIEYVDKIKDHIHLDYINYLIDRSNYMANSEDVRIDTIMVLLNREGLQ